jgi:hypothetical protein
MLKSITFILPLAIFGFVGMSAWMDQDAKAVVLPKSEQADDKKGVVVVPDPQVDLEGYAPLKFEEIYVTPAGPKELEYSSKANDLKGKKVRMDGFMVKHFNDDPQLFMFTAFPTSHNSAEYGLTDSLPVSLVHVVMKVRPGDAPIWTPRRLTVAGTLELGSRQEMDGRVSHVRILCDQVADSKARTSIELRKPLALQKDRRAMRANTDFRLPQTNNPKDKSQLTQ